MRITVRSSPIFDLPLDGDTVALLMEMSHHHYDSVCKEAGAVGGFLYGWNNSVTFIPELPVSATWRQADTLLKICENVTLYPTGGEERETVADVTATVRAAMRLWLRASEDWSFSTPEVQPKAERAGI